MRKYIILLLFIGIHYIARGQTAGEYRYWFDGDYSCMKCISGTTGSYAIDVSALTEGLHTLYSMMTDGNGQSTPVVSNVFMKPYIQSPADVTGYRYWFDNDIEHMQTMPYKSEVLALDVNSLVNGLHYLYVQAIGSKLSPVVSRMFVKLSEINLEAKVRAMLTINNKVYKETVMPQTGAAVWDIDVSDLPDGLHTAYVTLYNEQNVALSSYSSVFMKVPTGNRGISKYEYWVNDEDPFLGSVDVPECPDTYTLQALIPVSTHPIRSSCFEFRVEDGQPVIYAKNDIRIRFYDNRSRVTDVCKKFVDEQVKQVVTDIELLESGVQKTVGRPADNVIKWFKVEAERGDSLTFKTDLPCSIQLFSPSGKELYNTYGADALSFNGAYAPESGTYYLALHDVTSTKSNMLKVDYQHIDKYVLLRYTPKEIGVSESFVEIELDGNGFDKLVAAELSMGSTKITPSEIDVKSRSEAILRFYIDGTEELGVYNLLLDFREDDNTVNLTIDNAVKLAVPVFDVKVDVVLSNTIVRPYPVSIKITNLGNVGQSFIPLNIAFAGADSVNLVDFQNFYITISEAAYENGESALIKTDNFLGKGISAQVMNLFLKHLNPKETMELVLGFTSWANMYEEFRLYAWTGESLNEAITKERRPTNIPSIIDYLEYAEEAAEKIAPAREQRRVQRLIRVANVAQTIADNAASTGRVIGNISNGVDHYSDMARLKQYNIDPSDPIYETIANLHPVQTPTQIFDNNTTATHHLLRQWEQRQKNAQNSVPTPTGHTVSLNAPVDPNDIKGYTAESGARYLRQDKADVYYTIEFENDPETASAAAHTIVVNDNLDATKFDLSTFAATSVKIGNKTMQLNGEKQFVKTMDLRPTQDVIAQVSLDYDEQEGTAQWKIESLDPLTMEPILDVTRGALPVNTDGSGQGELSFDIKLKSNLVDGDAIDNYATIVFDQEQPISTPIWTNIVDGTAPVSSIEKVEIVNNQAKLQIAAKDNLSGVWSYNLYMQTDADDSWRCVGNDVPLDSVISIDMEQNLLYSFYVVATDSAGNVEQKNAKREYAVSLSGTIGDANGDGMVTPSDAIMILYHYFNVAQTGFNAKLADVNGDDTVTPADAVEILYMYFGGSSNSNSMEIVPEKEPN